jgi:hypothetical protein
MTKTITAAFEVPDNGQIITIQLADTRGIVVGTRMQIGFDSYLIIKIDQTSIVVEKHKTVIPVGMECLILE